jgi:hypothetical protein
MIFTPRFAVAANVWTTSAGTTWWPLFGSYEPFRSTTPCFGRTAARTARASFAPSTAIAASSEGRFWTARASTDRLARLSKTVAFASFVSGFASVGRRLASRNNSFAERRRVAPGFAPRVCGFTTGFERSVETPVPEEERFELGRAPRLPRAGPADDFFFGLDVEGGPNASAPNRSNPSKPGGSALARAGRAHRRGTRVVGHASRTSTSAKRAASADIARSSVEAGGQQKALFEQRVSLFHR